MGGWKRWAVVGVFVLGLVGALVYRISNGKPVSMTRGRLLMSTLFEITVVGPQSAPLAAWLDSAFAEVERVERMATDYDSTSLVGRLNAEPPGNVGCREAHVPEELFALLGRASGLCRTTDGAFDITTGTATALWRIAEGRGVPPTDGALDEAMLRIGPEHMRLDEAEHTVTLDPGTRIDLGGIAKGYAVDRALEVLRRCGVQGALVNGGGDMAAFGAPLRHPERSEWMIGIRHPRKGPMEYFGIVYLKSGAVASSGDYERGYAIRDSTYGHILDPHTARAAHRCISTTITAPTTEMADALATAVFVLGPDSGRAVLERIPGVEGIVVTERDGQLTAYPTSGFLAHAAIDTTQVRVAIATSGVSRRK